ncbi:ATP-binding protein [Emcibacter sp.]|uniref:ATP-binding protein n=1 Tax=Emcibacter sp. TaxID=1979954 RepID=UPI002AA87AC3|nr:ATP-binding protein [Emcibacter sp.]
MRICRFLSMLFIILTVAAQVGNVLWADDIDHGSEDAALTAGVLGAIREQIDSDPQQALHRTRDILEKKNSALSLQEKVELMGLQSGAQARLGNFKSGLETGRQALEMAANGDVTDRTIAYVYHSIGRNLEGLGQLPEAMKSYQRAYEKYDRAGDQRGLASSNLNFAGLFVGAKLFDKAIVEYEKALKLLDPEKDIFLYTRTLNNLGFTHVENGTATQALGYLDMARELAQKMGNELAIAYTFENSGEVLYYSGQYERAAEYLLFALGEAQKSGLEPLETVAYHFLGMVEFDRGNIEDAEYYADKAVQIAEKNEDAINLAKIYGLLSKLAREQRDYKEALRYQDLTLQYEDNLASENIVKALSLLETEFQLKERQQQIELLQRDNEIQRLSLKEQETFRFMGIGLVIVLCFSVGVLLYILRIKSQATALARVREKDLLESKLSAEAANQAKSEFLSYMSHELRTPLNAVMGFSETLRLQVFGELNAKQKEYIDHIHEGAALLLKLINDLLHLSKIETGAVELDLRPCDVGEVVHDVVPMVQHLIKRKQVQLHEGKIPEGLAPVLIDKIRLEQVLVNLISNAVKYGRDDGSVWLSVEKKNDGHVRISVKDDGIGISPDQFGNVFMPFNRAGMEQSGIEGTGAGLSIAKSLVEAMKGGIGFESTLGTGSCFWIDLPMEAGE